MSDGTKTLLIFGADGATGKRLVEQALDAGHTVRAAVHMLEEEPAPRGNLTWHEADLMTEEGLADLMDGVDAILSAVGIDAGPDTVIDPPKLHTEGTLNLIKAMREAGQDRLVVISASFAETMDRGPIWFQAAAKAGLRAIFEQMAEMERILAATDDIRWTAVRPGWLLDEAATGDYEVFDKVIPERLIRTRTGDLAHFMLHLVEDDAYIRGTPALARDEPAHKSGPHAVIGETVA